MTKGPPNIKRRVIRSAVLAVLGLLAVFLLYFSFTPVDLTGYHERIEAIILERTTHTVRFESVSLKALPSLELRLTGVRVMDEGEVLLSAASAHLKVSLVSLLRGPAVIKELDIGGVEMTVRRSSEGVVNVVEYVRKHPPRVLVPSIKLSDGRLTIIDEVPPSIPVFELTGMSAKAALSGRVLAFYLDSDLAPDAGLTVTGRFDREERTFKGGVKADGVELAEVVPYLKDVAPGLWLAGRAGADLRFTIEEDVLTSEGSLDYTGLVAAHATLPAGPVRSGSGSGTVAFTSGGQGLDLKLTDLRLNMEGFSIDASLALSDVAGERALDLNLETTGAPAEAIKGLIPVKADRKSVV